MNSSSSKRATGLAFVIVLLISLALFMTGCSYYATFSVKAFDFTFEYPRGWERTLAEQYTDLICVNIYDPVVVSEKETSVGVYPNVYLHPEGTADQFAQKLLDDFIWSYGRERNFQLIRKEPVEMDGSSGYLLEFTCDFPGGDMPVDSPAFFYVALRHVSVTIPRNNRVYEITISASQNEWDKWETDIQHILDSFRWK
jgi:hypothetical protein